MQGMHSSISKYKSLSSAQNSKGKYLNPTTDCLKTQAANSCTKPLKDGK